MAKTQAHRIKAISEIKSRTEFDKIVDDTVTMQLSKERLELRRDQKILAIREELDPDINDLAEKMEANVIRLEKYATEHRDELLPGKKKSSESTFAFFGFRMGNPTLVLLNRQWNWEKVTDAIKQAGALFAHFIVVKESVDKDGMKQKLNDEQLASVGTRIKQSETFFLDPKRDPADPQRLAAPAKEAA